MSRPTKQPYGLTVSIQLLNRSMDTRLHASVFVRKEQQRGHRGRRTEGLRAR